MASGKRRIEVIRLKYVALSCSMLLLAGCGGSDTKEQTPPVHVEVKPKEKTPPAKIDGEAKLQEVWLQVDGMSDKLKII